MTVPAEVLMTVSIPAFLSTAFEKRMSLARAAALADYLSYWKTVSYRMVPCYDCGRPARHEVNEPVDGYELCKKCHVRDMVSIAADDLAEQMSVC